MVLKPLPCTAYFFFTPRVVSTCDLENGQGDLQPIHHLFGQQESPFEVTRITGSGAPPSPHSRGDTRNADPAIFAGRYERTLVVMLLEVPLL